MAQKTLKISLVGMRFHSPPFNVGVEIKKTPPTLQHEPNNKHDEHAVAVLLRNHKVGYVDKESAFRVANILRMKANYEVNVKSISSTTINLDFIYEVKEKAPDAPKLSITNKTGIYKISVNDDERVYVGQSNSINERLKTHWNDLAQYSQAHSFVAARILSCAPLIALHNLQFPLLLGYASGLISQSLNQLGGWISGL